MSVPSLSEGVVLRPARRWWLRLLILLGFVAFAAITTVALYKKVLFCVWPALLLGTYPRARIKLSRFERAFFVAFVPIRVKRWSLDRFVAIETATEDPGVLDDYWWLFTNWWLISKLLDFMLPWIGGDYKLWLRSGSGKRMLAWQGNGEAAFHANLETLVQRTGLPVGRG